MSPIHDSVRPGIGLIRLAGSIFFGALLLCPTHSVTARSPIPNARSAVRIAELPQEARDTLILIRQGGPFPYARDGAVFANREGRLPFAARNTYREYTVKTPRSHDRGARRIISGKDKFWYTSDHYRSFRLIVE